MLVLLGLVVWASPAGAHGGPGANDPPASNYRTRILAVSPELPDVRWRVVEAGNRIELTNTGTTDVVVEDYDGKPYLRVGPRGVFENRNSAATYLNADATGQAAVPPRALSPDSPVSWRQVSTERSARWHDHRAHWMGGTDPPQVQAAPSQTHAIVPSFTIPARAGSTEIEVTGDVTWVPGSAGWPWLVASLVGGLLLTVLAWRHHQRLAVATVVVLALVASAVDVIGGWNVTAERTLVKLGEFATPSVTWLLLAASLWTLFDRRFRLDTYAFAGAGAVPLALIIGVTALDWLPASQVPSQLAPSLARLMVAGSLAAGIGAIGCFAIAWRSQGAKPPMAMPPARQAPARTRDAESPSGSLGGGRRPSRAVLLTGAAALAGAVMLIAALGERFGTDDQDPSSRRAANGRPVLVAVCRAARAASDGDGARSRLVFEQQAHADLHSLAATVTTTDRAVAARLLEAKQRVEAVLGADVQQLAGPLQSLISPTRRAARVAGWPAPNPCPESS